jgi:hypothetical protein
MKIRKTLIQNTRNSKQDKTSNRHKDKTQKQKEGDKKGKRKNQQEHLGTTREKEGVNGGNKYGRIE